MSENTNCVLRNRLLKISLIIYCIIICYTLINYCNNELYYERYPGIFVAYIQMIMKGYLSTNSIPLFPLFNSNISVPPEFQDSIKGIIVCESYFPNIVSLFLILHYISGIPIETMLVLPLGVFFVPIGYLAMIRTYMPKKNNSNLVLNLLLFIYILLYLGVTNFYGPFYIASPSFLLVIIIFISIRYLCNTNMKPEYLIVFFVTIFSLIQSWHTAFMITFFFVMSLFTILGFCYLIRPHVKFLLFDDLNILLVRSKFLILYSTLIFFSFTHLWYSKYTHEFLHEASFLDFFSKLVLKYNGKVLSSSPYLFNYKDMHFGTLYFKSVFYIYIISTLILMITFLFSIIEHKKHQVFKIKLSSIFLLTVILSQIVNVFFYYKTGSVNFIYVPLFFAFFSIYHYNDHYYEYKNDKTYKKIIMFLMLSLIFLSILSNISLIDTNQAGGTSETKYKDTEGSFDWLYSNMNISKPVILDFNILGKYVQREALLQKPHIHYVDLTIPDYSVLAGDTREIPSYLSQNYVIVDEATMSRNIPINVVESRGLLTPLLESINKNPKQDKIYTDSFISIRLFK